MKNHALFLSLVLVAACHVNIHAAPITSDWPTWRGPTGDGIAPQDADVPLQWSQSQNIVWSADVPGKGHASPIVVGDQVLIATCDDSSGSQSLISYGRDDGKPRWVTRLHKGRLVKINRKNSHASLTPACDGKRIYTLFTINATLHVSAVDLSGKIVWQKALGPYKSEHGHGASPLIHESNLIISGEDHTGGYLTAIDRSNGRQVWKIARRRADTHANYATPTVGKIAGRNQLILHGYDRITSYDPATGKMLWFCKGPTEVCANTPVFDEQFVYASGGYPGKLLLCIRADGKGDVSRTHVKWTDRSGVAYVPSSILHNGHLYVVNDQGMATCYAVGTGKIMWQQRLRDKFSASPILVGDRLYMAAESGTTYVLQARPTFMMLATNKLSNGQMATPAVSGNLLLIRTGKRLYCVGDASK